MLYTVFFLNENTTVFMLSDNFSLFIEFDNILVFLFLKKCFCYAYVWTKYNPMSLKRPNLAQILIFIEKSCNPPAGTPQPLAYSPSRTPAPPIPFCG